MCTPIIPPTLLTPADSCLLMGVRECMCPVSACAATQLCVCVCVKDSNLARVKF